MDNIDMRRKLILNRKDIGITYRECFNYKNPSKGERVEIKYMQGIGFYIFYPNCPDSFDIIEGWFSNRKKAIDFALKNGWAFKARQFSPCN